MSSSESWVLEKVTELKTALVGRFREEAAIQTSLKNLVTLKQPRNNKLHLDLLALRRVFVFLSEKNHQQEMGPRHVYACHAEGIKRL